MAFEQLSGGVEQKRQDQTVGFRQIERCLQRGAGRTGFLQSVACHRLKQEGLHLPHLQVGADRCPFEDGGERGHRGLRIALGEPQHGQGLTGRRGVVLVALGLGQDLLRAIGVAQSHQCLDVQGSGAGRERVMGHQTLTERRAPAEGAHRLTVSAACQFMQAAGVVEHHGHGRVELVAEGGLGPVEPWLGLFESGLPEHRHPERDTGDGNDRFLGPAMPLSQAEGPMAALRYQIK